MRCTGECFLIPEKTDDFRCVRFWLCNRKREEDGVKFELKVGQSPENGLFSTFSVPELIPLVPIIRSLLPNFLIHTFLIHNVDNFALMDYYGNGSPSAKSASAYTIHNLSKGAS